MKCRKSKQKFVFCRNVVELRHLQGETMTVAEKQQPFDKLLEVFGSYKGISEALNIKYVTVYAWFMRNGIPEKHHDTIIAKSEGKITKDDLV